MIKFANIMQNIMQRSLLHKRNSNERTNDRTLFSSSAWRRMPHGLIKLMSSLIKFNTK